MTMVTQTLTARRIAELVADKKCKVWFAGVGPFEVIKKITDATAPQPEGFLEFELFGGAVEFHHPDQELEVYIVPKAKPKKYTKDQLMKDLGMTKVRGNLGGIYYE